MVMPKFYPWPITNIIQNVTRKGRPSLTNIFPYTNTIRTRNRTGTPTTPSTTIFHLYHLPPQGILFYLPSRFSPMVITCCWPRISWFTVLDSPFKGFIIGNTQCGLHSTNTTQALPCTQTSRPHKNIKPYRKFSIPTFYNYTKNVFPHFRWLPGQNSSRQVQAYNLNNTANKLLKEKALGFIIERHPWSTCLHV